jgi:hypothetical protein
MEEVNRVVLDGSNEEASKRLDRMIEELENEEKLKKNNEKKLKKNKD